MRIEPLRHSGKVVAVDNHYATVEITDNCSSSCGGCKLSGLCGSDGGRVVVQASYPEDNVPLKGQKVVIEAKGETSLKAAFLLLCLPLTAFLAAALVLSALGAPDYLSAAGAAVAALLCFIIVRISGSRRLPSWFIVNTDI